MSKSSKRATISLALSLGISWFGYSHAAENAYAELSLSGARLVGDSTTTTMGSEDVSDHIEVFQFQNGVGPGKRTAADYGPMVLVKRVDRASPQLIRAIAEGQPVEGDIKFFNRNRETGEIQRYYTIRIYDARVTGVRQLLPDTLDPASANKPVLEEVQIDGGSITWIDELNGNEFGLPGN